MEHRCYYARMGFPRCLEVADPAQTLIIPATDPQEQDEELHYCTTCGPVARNMVAELIAVASDDQLTLSETADRMATITARTRLQLHCKEKHCQFPGCTQDIDPAQTCCIGGLTMQYCKNCGAQVRELMDSLTSAKDFEPSTQQATPVQWVGSNEGEQLKKPYGNA